MWKPFRIYQLTSKANLAIIEWIGLKSYDYNLVSYWSMCYGTMVLCINLQGVLLSSHFSRDVYLFFLGETVSNAVVFTLHNIIDMYIVQNYTRIFQPGHMVCTLFCFQINCVKYTFYICNSEIEKLHVWVWSERKIISCRSLFSIKVSEICSP